jgi:hypothetical protein
MKRGLLIVAGGIVTLGIVAAVVIFFFLGSLIKTAVETAGSEVTKTTVTLADADVDLSSGKGTLKGFKMANPSGFKSDSAFRFGEVSVTVDTSTLGQDPIVIKEVLIDAPKITYEIGANGSNIDKIKENVEAFQKSMGGGGSGSGSSGGDEGPKLIIENIYLRNGKVSIMASQLMDKTLDTDLPEIHLTDIGKEEGGASAGEVASQTIDSVLAQVTTLVGSIDLSSITDALGENAAGAIKAIGEGAGDATKVLGDGAGGAATDAVKDAGKSATDAVKGLLGNDD